MNQPNYSPGRKQPWQERFRESFDYVVTHGPGLLRRTSDQGLRAYRQGARVLATSELSSSGVDAWTGFVAAVVTLLSFLCANLVLSSWVRSSYASYKPEFLRDVQNLGEAKRALQSAGWIPLDPGAEDEVIQRIRDEDFGLPLHRWIEIEFLESGMDSERDDLHADFRRLVEGSPRGWIMTRPTVTTGGEVYGQLLKRSPEILGLVDRDPVRKHALLAMLDDLTAAIQRPIRWQLRLNGIIQFATIFVGVLVLTAVVRRNLFLTRLADRWLGRSLWETVRAEEEANPSDIHTMVERLWRSDDVDVDALIRAEVEQLRRDTTVEVYNVYWFLAGIMPSLGFIGTVVGMSSSLMLADRLFVAADRQLAIARMTSELGLAFDTTLVALVFGLIAGIPIAAVHARERIFFRALAGRIFDVRRQQRSIHVATTVAEVGDVPAR